MLDGAGPSDITNPGSFTTVREAEGAYAKVEALRALWVGLNSTLAHATRHLVPLPGSKRTLPCPKGLVP